MRAPNSVGSSARLLAFLCLPPTQPTGTAPSSHVESGFLFSAGGRASWELLEREKIGNRKAGPGPVRVPVLLVVLVHASGFLFSFGSWLPAYASGIEEARTVPVHLLFSRIVQPSNSTSLLVFLSGAKRRNLPILTSVCVMIHRYHRDHLSKGKL